MGICTRRSIDGLTLNSIAIEVRRCPARATDPVCITPKPIAPALVAIIHIGVIVFLPTLNCVPVSLRETSVGRSGRQLLAWFGTRWGRALVGTAGSIRRVA